MPIGRDIRESLAKIFFHNPISDIPYKPREYINLAKIHGMEEGLAPIKNGVERVYLESLRTRDIELCLSTFAEYVKISCDGDGIKPVNKIGTFEAGTELLNAIFGALHNEPLTMFLENTGIQKVVFTRAGGDEVDFLFRKSGGIEEIISYETISEISPEGTALDLLEIMLVTQVTNTPFHFLDFHSPYAQSKLGKYGRKLLEEAEKFSGTKFYFTPSSSVGRCTLLEGYMSYLNKGGDLTISLEELAKKLMGEVEDICSKRVEETKLITKKHLWLSDDPTKKMQAYMTIRGDEDKKFAIFKDESRKLTLIFKAICGTLNSILERFFTVDDTEKYLFQELKRLQERMELNLKERELLEDIRKEFLVEIGED
ncbi:MAG TPA: hypothetical protein DIC35_03175 [Candidatus Moranbacteria bacterium]|nr:hypothetical protein [Candidatus Moranbacteria bacterium]